MMMRAKSESVHRAAHCITSPDARQWKICTNHAGYLVVTFSRSARYGALVCASFSKAGKLTRAMRISDGLTMPISQNQSRLMSLV